MQRAEWCGHTTGVPSLARVARVSLSGRNAKLVGCFHSSRSACGCSGEEGGEERGLSVRLVGASVAACLHLLLLI